MTTVYLILVALSGAPSAPVVPLPAQQMQSAAVCKAVAAAYVRLAGADRLRASCLDLGEVR